MRSSVVRLLTSPAMNQVLGKLKAEAPIYIENLKTANKQRFYQKITAINTWYTKLLGLDEVKQYQDRVVSLQERLLATQERRREIGRQLSEIRKKSNLLQDEIHKVKRSEDLERFLNLMKEETEVIKLEHEIARQFQDCDQAERELFTAFTNAVRDSHEKQRAQLEYTKYFGIILSIAGSFLTFCYSTLRKDDLKRFIEENISRSLAAASGNFNRNNTNNSSTLVEMVKSETAKLTKMVDLNQSRVSYLLEKEEEEKRRQTLYFYVGTTVLVLFLLKLLSSN